MNNIEIIKEITKGVDNRIPTKDIAYQFVLEELDAASQGNKAAIQFVQDSGFSEAEYKDAMKNSSEEVDGVNGPQQFLLNSVMPYASNIDLMVNTRLSVVKNIIEEWELQSDTEYRINNLMKALKSILEDDEDVMPTIAPNIPVPQSATARQIYFREENISSAKNIISILSDLTSEDDETIILKSLEGSLISPINNSYKTETEVVKNTPKDVNFFIRGGYGVVSLFVGLSAFSIFKLIFMIPLNLIATPENVDSMQSFSSILIILAIYLAVKYTKKLNITGTRKSRINKRVVTIIAGVISMVIATVVVNIPII